MLKIVYINYTSIEKMEKNMMNMKGAWHSKCSLTSRWYFIVNVLKGYIAG